jgi:hypothetical protein
MYQDKTGLCSKSLYQTNTCKLGTIIPLDFGGVQDKL